MKTTRFDSLTKEMATSTTRRHALVGLGALALGSGGIFGLRSQAAADARDHCHQRCRQRNNSKNNGTTPTSATATTPTSATTAATSGARTASPQPVLRSR
jgi:hypothetical protein